MRNCASGELEIPKGAIALAFPLRGAPSCAAPRVPPLSPTAKTTVTDNGNRRRHKFRQEETFQNDEAYALFGRDSGACSCAFRTAGLGAEEIRSRRQRYRDQGRADHAFLGPGVSLRHHRE